MQTFAFILLLLLAAMLGAGLVVLAYGGLLYSLKRTWFHCEWCGCYFDDVGNTQTSAPAKVNLSVDRCPECHEAAAAELRHCRSLREEGALR